MNKPIRTISIFCLLLFLALMLNATYLQYWQAGALNDDPRNRRVLEEAFSSERGAILVGRDAGRRERASPTTATSSSGPTPSPSSTPPSPAGSPTSARPASSGRRTRCSPARTPGSSSPGWSTCSATPRPRAAACSSRSTPTAQDAACSTACGLGEDVEGAVVAIEPSTGKILAMASLPTYDPNQLAVHDFDAVADDYEELRTRRPSRCSTARSRPGCRPARRSSW